MATRRKKSKVKQCNSFAWLRNFSSRTTYMNGPHLHQQEIPQNFSQSEQQYHSIISENCSLHNSQMNIMSSAEECSENNVDLDSIPDHQLLISLSIPKPNHASGISRKPFGVATLSPSSSGYQAVAANNNSNNTPGTSLNPIDAIPLPDPLPSSTKNPANHLSPGSAKRSGIMATQHTAEDCEAASSIASLTSAADIIDKLPGMVQANTSGTTLLPTPAASTSSLVIYANLVFSERLSKICIIPITTASVVLGGSDDVNFQLGKSFPIPSWYPWLFGPESAMVPVGRLDENLCRYHALIGFNWQLKIFQIAALDNSFPITVDGTQYTASDGAVALRSNSKIALAADIQMTFDLSMMTSTLSSNLSHSIFRFIQSLQAHHPHNNQQQQQYHPTGGHYSMPSAHFPSTFYDECLLRILQTNGPMTLRMLLAKLESENPKVAAVGQKLPLLVRARLTSNPRFARCQPPEYLPYQGKDSFWTLATNLGGDGQSIGRSKPADLSTAVVDRQINTTAPSPRYSPDPKKARLSAGAASIAASSTSALASTSSSSLSLSSSSSSSSSSNTPPSLLSIEHRPMAAMNEHSVSAFKQFVSEAQSANAIVGSTGHNMSANSSVLTAPSSRAHSPHYTPPSYLRNPIYHRPIGGTAACSMVSTGVSSSMPRSRSMIVESSQNSNGINVGVGVGGNSGGGGSGGSAGLGLLESRKVFSETSLPNRRDLIVPAQSSISAVTAINAGPPQSE